MQYLIYCFFCQLYFGIFINAVLFKSKTVPSCILDQFIKIKINYVPSAITCGIACDQRADCLAMHLKQSKSECTLYTGSVTTLLNELPTCNKEIDLISDLWEHTGRVNCPSNYNLTFAGQPRSRYRQINAEGTGVNWNNMATLCSDDGYKLAQLVDAAEVEFISRTGML